MRLGKCQPSNSNSPICQCDEIEWTGDHCQEKINYCAKIKCENGGVCRPLSGSARCECVNENYSGEFCEIVSTKIILKKIVAKSFAFVAILAMSIVMIFVVVMDILKYCFGIDPVAEVREEVRRERLAKRREHQAVIVHYKYVHDPSNV